MTEYQTATAVAKTIALAHIAGVKPRLFESLVRHFGSLDRILHADSGTLMAIPGMTTGLANNISSASQSLEKADQYLSDLTERGIHAVSRFDDSYPALLFELNDPPPLLFVRGSLPDSTRKIVAIVGTESATAAGIELTVKLAGRFIESGVQVISSLNSGIDAAAHLGAKGAKGNSFAVLEAGFDHVYPEDHMPLAIDVASTGGAVTEYSPDIDYEAQNFVDANRLIVGLAHGVVVTEVYKDSERTLDLLSCCSQIGKLLFMMIDPVSGALADGESMRLAVSYGAIPMVGWDRVSDMVDALV